MRSKNERSAILPELNSNFKVNMLHNRDPNVDILEFGNQAIE